MNKEMITEISNNSKLYGQYFYCYFGNKAFLETFYEPIKNEINMTRLIQLLTQSENNNIDKSIQKKNYNDDLILLLNKYNNLKTNTNNFKRNGYINTKISILDYIPTFKTLNKDPLNFVFVNFIVEEFIRIRKIYLFCEIIEVLIYSILEKEFEKIKERLNIFKQFKSWTKTEPQNHNTFVSTINNQEPRNEQLPVIGTHVKIEEIKNSEIKFDLQLLIYQTQDIIDRIIESKKILFYSDFNMFKKDIFEKIQEPNTQITELFIRPTRSLFNNPPKMNSKQIEALIKEGVNVFYEKKQVA